MCVLHCRYDLYNVEVKPQSQYSTRMGVNYAGKGFHYITLSVDELLFEGGQSVRFVCVCFDVCVEMSKLCAGKGTVPCCYPATSR